MQMDNSIFTKSKRGTFVELLIMLFYFILNYMKKFRGGRGASEIVLSHLLQVTTMQILKDIL